MAEPSEPTTVEARVHYPDPEDASLSLYVDLVRVGAGRWSDGRDVGTWEQVTSGLGAFGVEEVPDPGDEPMVSALTQALDAETSYGVWSCRDLAKRLAPRVRAALP